MSIGLREFRLMDTGSGEWIWFEVVGEELICTGKIEYFDESQAGNCTNDIFIDNKLDEVVQ